MSKCEKRFAVSQGFTLIELMVVIVIAAILLTIAVPSFDSLIKKNNVEAMQSKLASAVATARTEAASRNKVVTICSLNKATSDCLNGVNWSGGWVVFENSGDLTRIDGSDIVIDIFENNGSYIMEGSGNGFSFSSQGYLAGGAAGFVAICDAGKNMKYARGLYVNASGLVVKMSDTDSDGIQNIPGGSNLVAANCP